MLSLCHLIIQLQKYLSLCHMNFLSQKYKYLLLQHTIIQGQNVDHFGIRQGQTPSLPCTNYSQ